MKEGSWRTAALKKAEEARVAKQTPAAETLAPMAEAGRRIIDISPLVNPGLSVWPGDVPYKSSKTKRMSKGAGIDLGDMHTSYHIGAHTDSPQHYHLGGRDAASLPLEAYFGRCQVVDVKVVRGERFGWDDLSQVPAAARVLFKTGTFPDPRKWNNDFSAPEPELLDRLGGMGVQLVGFDTPSTDTFDSEGLPAHQMLFKHGMMNLEGLVLDHVDPGFYTLIALPLKLEDADASPVRAVLVKE